MTHQEAVAALRAHIARLTDNDQAFAHSLLASAAGRGLTEKQRYWVEKLAARATGKETAPQVVQVGNFAGVIALFKQARQHLKFPKIRLQLDDGRPVCLSLAGERSRRPGTVNVTDGGRYGNNTWFGRVEPSGAWERSERADAETQTAVAALLTALAGDPAGVAARYGKLTGNCCFCDRNLTDERSTAVGYGRDCAKHFGLPWGAAPKAEAAAVNDEQTGFAFGGWINR